MALSKTRVLVGSAILGLAFLSTSAGASTSTSTGSTAATDTSSTALIQPSTSVTFAADWGGWYPGAGTHNAQGAILVSSADVETLTVAAYFENGSQILPVTVTPHDDDSSASDGVSAVDLSFATRGTDHSGWLVIRAGSKDPESVPFTIIRQVNTIVFMKPIIGGLLFAIVVLFCRHVSLRGKLTDQLKWDTPLAITDAKWTFSDSWASMITAVGAVLGTVLASKDFAANALAGLSLTGFIELSFGFALVALFAPLTFTAALKDGKGTYLGLMAAAFLTSLAAVGQLLSLSIMLTRGGASFWVGAAMNVAVVGILLIYVWRSIGDLVSSTESPMKRQSAIL